MFINFSNHSSENWSEKQRDAALEYGEIKDYPFPQVEADATEEMIKKLTMEIVGEIVDMNPSAVMCQGEFTLAYSVTSELQKRGIKVLSACSDRESVEWTDGDGVHKESRFVFTRFREYPGTAVAKKPAINEEKAEAIQKDKNYQAVPSNNKHKNVLIMAMSTISPNVRTTMFSYKTKDGKAGSVIGRYQLDPIPKMLSIELGKVGECLDRVIMLCTEKVKEETTFTTEEDGKHEDESPIDYFKEQIKNYKNPEVLDDDFYSMITVNENKPEEGVNKAVQAIRKIKGEDNVEMRLYLDTHGGLRGVQRVLEATISLLKLEGISIENTYSVEYVEYVENGVNKKKSEIRSEEENMRIYDFVSGIHEFSSSGRTDSLIQYIPRDNKLVNAMTKISNSIQWCSVKKFEEGLTELREELKRNADEDGYLKIFKEYIEKDYGVLIRANSVIDEIEWCLKKHYYQQAVSLLESRMSQYYITNGWISNNITGGTNTNWQYNQHRNQYELQVNGRINRFTLNEIFNSVINDRRDINGNNLKDIITLWDRKFNQLSARILEEKRIKLDSSKTQFIGFDDSDTAILKEVFRDFTVDYRSSDSELIDGFIINNKILNNREMFRYFMAIMALHKNLKMVRNEMNHIDRFTYDPEKVKLAMDYFIKWVREFDEELAKM